MSSECPYCGAVNEFRTSEYGPHPINGCTCMRDAIGGAAAYDGGYRPQRCNKCNQLVFFIRHNGGCIYVNDMGWPWPKHECYMSRGDEQFITDVEFIWSKYGHDSRIGVVVRRRPGDIRGSESIFIAVSFAGGIGMCFNVHRLGAPRLGSAVVYISQDAVSELRTLEDRSIRVIKSGLAAALLGLPASFPKDGIAPARSRARSSAWPSPVMSPLPVPNRGKPICHKCHQSMSSSVLEAHIEACDGSDLQVICYYCRRQVTSRRYVRHLNKCPGYKR